MVEGMELGLKLPHKGKEPTAISNKSLPLHNLLSHPLTKAQQYM